jgi:circadian clock protein KaiC
MDKIGAIQADRLGPVGIGIHDHSIRACHIISRGIALGEPLMSFRGVLRGVPTLVADDAKLLATPI